MDRIREVCSVALGLREDHRLRARLPLARLTVAGGDVADLEGWSTWFVTRSTSSRSC